MFSLFKKQDNYVWGKEDILYGYKIDQKYTFKLLRPKKGKLGCLSLQYHKEKSETWYVVSGTVWGLIITDKKILTLILNEGDHVSLEPGTIHRLMPLSENAVVAEASTLDKYAVEPYTQTKDVIRLHCVHGRDCDVAPTKKLEKAVKLSIEITEDTIDRLNSNKPILPIECTY